MPWFVALPKGYQDVLELWIKECETERGPRNGSLWAWKADDDGKAKHEGNGALYYDDRGSSLLITHLPGGALQAKRKPTSFLSNSAFLSTGGGGSTTSAALEEEAPDGAARGGLQNKSVASSSTSSFSTTKAAKSVLSSSGFNREKHSFLLVGVFFSLVLVLVIKETRHVKCKL